MDRYVASPQWHEWIILYFYLGGIAAGAYAVFSMVSLVGSEAERRAVRVSAYLAFPLVNLCGLILVIDLTRPERFWHMLIQSQMYRPMLKWWSPMSAGSWGLSAFGAFSFASFVGVLAEDRWFGLGRWSPLARRLRCSPVGRVFELGGTLSAFFLGAYTGTLLSATNQPVWSDSTWLSALFLASSASTGVAAMLLLVRWRLRETSPEIIDRLEWVDAWAMILELAVLAAFAVSLGELARPALLHWPGVLIPAFVVPAGIVLPLIVRSLPGPRWGIMSAISILIAGLVLRYAIVGMAEPLLDGS
jgi:formate-dependent nitrite reductase membrane component NrfD